MNKQKIGELDQLHARICQALADPKRILILYALHNRPHRVSALAEQLNLPRPTVSRHLAILRDQALVSTERSGPAVIYSLADRRIIEVLETMRQLMLENLAEQSDLVAYGNPA